MLERKIEEKVCRIAWTRYGVRSRKMNGAGQTGWPDRMFLLPGGTPLFIEFKRPGGRVGRRQLHIHGILRELQYEVRVCDDTESAIQAIEQALAAARISEKGG